MRPYGGEPTPDKPAQSLIPAGGRTRDRPLRRGGSLLPTDLALAVPGGLHPGPNSGFEGSAAAGIGRLRAADYNYCQPLWRGYRPSDATWKQRLGLITLTPWWVMRPEGLRLQGRATEVWRVACDFSHVPRNRNDIVVFRRFFFFFPSYTWQPWCASLAARKCSRPQLFFPESILLGKLHKSPRSHTTQVRFR